MAEFVGDMYRTTRLTPEQLDLVFSKKAVDYLSTSQVQTLIQDSPDATRTALEKMMHLRFTPTHYEPDPVDDGHPLPSYS